MIIKPLQQPEPQVGNIYYIDTLNRPEILNNWYKIKGIFEIIRVMHNEDYKLKALSGFGPRWGGSADMYRIEFFWDTDIFKKYKKLGYIKYKSINYETSNTNMESIS